jgi:hypothetical protein
LPPSAGWTSFGGFPSSDEVGYWLLSREMLPNAQGPIATDIRIGNNAAIYYLSLAQRNTHLKPFFLAAAAIVKADALLTWKSMVQGGADWDHKRIVRSLFGYGAERDGFIYNFDVWSNIHYGYVGRSVGFTELELHGGAGGAQVYMDHTSDPSYWRTWGDEPADQKAISIGEELWDTYGLNVTPERFWEVFDHSAHMLSRYEFGDIPRYGTASGGGTSVYR